MAIIVVLFVCFEDMFGYHGNQVTARKSTPYIYEDTTKIVMAQR